MLECRAWEQSRRRLACYRRRQPEKSALYRIVSSERDRLPLVWEERFQAQYGALRPVVLETFDQYLNCGLLQNGAARVYCDACRHSFLVAFSCKTRCFCPSCSAKRAVKFAEHLYQDVLEDVEQRHVVASIPIRLRCFFRYDRKLLDLLFGALWQSLRELLCPADGVPGLVATVQTAGESLRWNPHDHGVLSNGTWNAAGVFVPFDEIGPATTQQLTHRFAELILAALEARGLIDSDVTAQILSQEHTGFSVWLSEPFQDQDHKLFVARYIERGPISLEKISIDQDIVNYTTKDGKVHEFDALEFLALLSSHIPNRGESLTRYYGRYSCRSRGERRKQAAVPAEQMVESGSKPAERKKPSSSWAACIRRIYEINPLQCPKCGSEMRIIAFLTDQHTISDIMESLGIPKAHAPPPIPAGPLFSEAELCDYEYC